MLKFLIIIISFQSCSFVTCQDNIKNLRGNVTDHYRNPLQGAIVILKNESRYESREKSIRRPGDHIIPGFISSPLAFYAGGETNIYGDYNFPVSFGKHILEISYTGFKTLTDTILVTINSWDVHNYCLEPDFNDSALIVGNVPRKYLDSSYIKPGEEFGFGILVNNIPVIGLYKFRLQCRFISHDSSFYTFKVDSFRTKFQKEYNYTIKAVNDLSSSYFKLTKEEISRYAEKLGEGFLTFKINAPSASLKLITNEIYDILGEVCPGWPSATSFFIKKDSLYLFSGVSDFQLDRTIKLPEDFPFTIKLLKKLKFNYLIDGPFICYNMLYDYRSGNQEIILNQNESGTLGGYFIYQPISRNQELLVPGHAVWDGGVNGISFVIIRK